jgi:hypothetical protein
LQIFIFFDGFFEVLYVLSFAGFCGAAYEIPDNKKVKGTIMTTTINPDDLTSMHPLHQSF